MKKPELFYVPVENCRSLKRNPQYLTEKQMESLKKSIEKDGFLVPILLRPIPKTKFYEIVAGNHRWLAARELGLKEVPAIMADMDDKTSKRIAVNSNTIHGQPNVELLAPFLAEMSDELLRDIHLEDAAIKELMEFDATLAKRLEEMQIPEGFNNASSEADQRPCICPKCERQHFAAVKKQP